MGYDANAKSDRAERRQHMIILYVIIAICALFTVVVLTLQSASPPPPAASLSAVDKILSDARQAAAIAAREVADVKKLQKRAKELDGGEVTSNLRKRGGVDGSEKKQQAAAENDEMKIVRAADKRATLEKQVRFIKATGIIMEADDNALEMTGNLQKATREMLKLRYGDFGSKNYRVKMDLEFQSTIPDFAEKGKDGTLMVEMAPIDLVPCSVYNFLEIARTWKDGAFHRNAGHVLQAMVHSDVKKSMPFQEYHKDFPHKRGTLGYAGRPSGPEFYISIEDNTDNHGPGTQQDKNPYEADSIIGRVIDGGMEDVVPRIHKMPGQEFLGDKHKWVLIRRMHILVPGNGPGSVDGYVEYSKSPNIIEK